MSIWVLMYTTTTKAMMMMMMILMSTVLMTSSLKNHEYSEKGQDAENLRTSLRRQLQGGASDLNLSEEQMEEAAMIAGAVLVVLLLLCCCCCRRFSLWDCVALACLWEICCDNSNAGCGGDVPFTLCID